MVDEPSVRQNCPEQFWTAAGWPWSAQRGRVRPRRGRTIPRHPHTSAHNPNPGAFCVSGGETVVDEPSVIWRIPRLTLRAIGCADVRFGIHACASDELSGTNPDSRRLAPQRAARRGEARERGWRKPTGLQRRLRGPSSRCSLTHSVAMGLRTIDKLSSRSHLFASVVSTTHAPGRAEQSLDTHTSPRTTQTPGVSRIWRRDGGGRTFCDSALPAPPPSGHRLRRCSVWHPRLRERQNCPEHIRTAKAGPVGAWGRAARGAGSKEVPPLPHLWERLQPRPCCRSRRRRRWRSRLNREPGGQAEPPGAHRTPWGWQLNRAT